MKVLNLLNYKVIIVIILFTSLNIMGEVYDVQHYNISVDLFHSLTENDIQYTGEVEISLLIDTMQTNQIDLDSFELQIDSIKIDTLKLNYSVMPNFININLNRIYYRNEVLNIKVFYAHQDTVSQYYGGYRLSLPSEYLSQKVAYTFGLPRYAHYWFPCKDDPSDLATLDLTVVVPLTGYTVASNGNLVNISTNNNKKYYHWHDSFQIRTAVIFFAVSNYEVLTQSFSIDNIQKVLKLYFYPVNGNVNFSPDVCFTKIKEILEFYSSIYPNYPFNNLKFVFAQGVYSNQTITNIDETSLNHLSGSGYSFFTHEIAHQWFGSNLCAGSLRELWMNEGFANYSSLLFDKYKYGESQFKNTLNYFAQITLLNDAVLVTDSIYNPTIYSKAPCVIDMLRYCLGDSVYWSTISQLFEQFSFKSFTSYDLINIIQSLTSEDYNWFFNQWVFNAGYPIYNIEYHKIQLSGNVYEVHIHVKQIQTTQNLFKMPLQFRITSNIADTTFTLLNDARDQIFTVKVNGSPDSIKFDEDNRILLKKVSSITSVKLENQNSIQNFSLSQNYPNPFNPSTEIKYRISEAGIVNVKIYDILGKEITTLVKEFKSPGEFKIIFDASNLPSGIYFYSLKTRNFYQVKKMVLIK